jgi:hypothetical protein
MSIRTRSGDDAQIEYCDHLQQVESDRERMKQAYPITLQLGEKRILLLCVPCGKSFQADILSEIIRGSVRERMQIGKKERDQE